MPTGLTADQRRALWGAKSIFNNNRGDSTVPNVQQGRFSYGGAWAARNYIAIVSGGEVGSVLPLGGFMTEGYMGVAVFRGESATNSSQFISFYHAGLELPQFSVVFVANGVIQLRRGSTLGTLITQTSAGTYQNDRWFFVEIYGSVADSGGNIQVRVNTEVVIDAVSIDSQGITSTDQFDSIRLAWRSFSGSGSNLDYMFDDFYFCDTAGSINNGFLGNVRVKTQFTSGNSTPLDFTIGGTSPAATNWQSVQNRLLNNSTFVFTGTVGNTDLYELQAILDSPVVFGVQVSGAYWQDDSTQKIARNVIKSSTTTLESGDIYINQDPTYYPTVFELNPHTSLGWTGAEVNALLAGPKLQA